MKSGGLFLLLLAAVLLRSSEHFRWSSYPRQPVFCLVAGSPDSRRRGNNRKSEELAL